MDTPKERRTKKGFTCAFTAQMPGVPGFSEPFEITIDASPEAWHELQAIALGDPEGLAKAIYLNFAKPVIEALGTSVRYDKNVFMRESRQFTAAAYVVAQYFAKCPKHEWPEPFLAFLEEPTPLKKTTNRKTGLLSAGDVAHSSWVRRFEREIEGFCLNLKGHRESFKQTYIDHNAYIEEARKIFTEEISRHGKTPTIEQLHNSLKGLP